MSSPFSPIRDVLLQSVIPTGLLFACMRYPQEAQTLLLQVTNGFVTFESFQVVVKVCSQQDLPIA